MWIDAELIYSFHTTVYVCDGSIWAAAICTFLSLRTAYKVKSMCLTNNREVIAQ
jgi:hypothetical protein